MAEMNDVLARYNAKKKKRKKRRKYAFYSMLIVFFVLLITVLSVTVFFNISDIAVTGNEKYTDAEIIAASGLEKGQNLFRINKFRIIDDMYLKLPYAAEITIDRHLPVGIEIIVTESKPYFYTESDGRYFLVAEDLKVLEAVAFPPEDLPLVTGLDSAVIKVGEVMTDEEGFCNRLSSLTSALKKHMGDGCISAIDVSVSYEMTFEYLGRIKVTVGTAEKIDYKLQLVKHVIEKNNENEHAVIDASSGDIASYRTVDSINGQEQELSDDQQEDGQDAEQTDTSGDAEKENE